MPAIRRGPHITNIAPDDLEGMIGPDVHRPGPARARLRTEQIPVWAIIGHLKAVADTSNSSDITDVVIVQVAADYDVAIEAVLAALHYYREHSGEIDALLEANAAALA